MRWLLTFLIVLVMQLVVQAQSRSRFLERLADTTDRENTLMYGQAGFHFPIESNFCHAGHGFQFSLGINPAYLFSKEWIVGVYAGLKWKELFNWPGKFDPTFTFDLQNLSQPGNGSEHDSILIEYFTSQTTIKYQLGGIGYGQLGFIIGNSRMRYLPLIKISRSWTAWSVEGYMYDGVYTNDFIYLHTQREYGVAMSWTILRDEDRRVTLGPYLHWTNFKSLNLEGLWFHEFADPMLVEKYPRVWRTGITLSFEYY